jgi:hypothetical protein
MIDLIVANEILLPSQVPPRCAHMTGERRLALAVIDDAVAVAKGSRLERADLIGEDLRILVRLSTEQRDFMRCERARKRTLVWIASPAAGPLTFRWWCDIARFEDEVAAAIGAWATRELASVRARIAAANPRVVGERACA